MTKFCTQCGATVAETARFCNKCGTKLLMTQTQTPEQSPTMTYQSPSGSRPQSAYDYNPLDARQQSPAAGADLQPNVAAMLCYPLFLVTGIIFLVLDPYNKDRTIRFHAYQSIFFTVAIFVLNIVINILGIILPWFLESLLSRSLTLLAIGGTVWMMYQAYQGIMFKLPVIGDLAENQANKP